MTYKKEDLKNIPASQIKQLNKTEKNIYLSLKRRELQDKELYINSLIENIPKDPFTKKFEKDHVYENENNLSKKDNSKNTALTRSYGDKSGEKVSTTLVMSHADGYRELKQALSQLRPEDIGDNKQIKRGTFFDSARKYAVNEESVVFKKNGRQRSVSSTQCAMSMFRYAIKIEDNQPKIHHLENRIK